MRTGALPLISTDLLQFVRVLRCLNRGHFALIALFALRIGGVPLTIARFCHGLLVAIVLVLGRILIADRYLKTAPTAVILSHFCGLLKEKCAFVRVRECMFSFSPCFWAIVCERLKGSPPILFFSMFFLETANSKQAL